jgi:hypothetical protein
MRIVTSLILAAIILTGSLFFQSCSRPVATAPATREIPPPPFMSNKTAAPKGKPVIQAFDVSPDIIRKHLDQATTLHWNVQDASEIYISNVGYVPPMGSMAIKPNQSGIYTLTATNQNGSVSISKPLTVEP